MPTCEFFEQYERAGSAAVLPPWVYTLQGAEGATGDSKAKLAVVRKVCMSVATTELLVREEMKTESNSHHLQRRLPVQLKVNGLFIEATLSTCHPWRLLNHSL